MGRYQATMQPALRALTHAAQPHRLLHKAAPSQTKHHCTATRRLTGQHTVAGPCNTSCPLSPGRVGGKSYEGHISSTACSCPDAHEMPQSTHPYGRISRPKVVSNSPASVQAIGQAEPQVTTVTTFKRHISQAIPHVPNRTQPDCLAPLRLDECHHNSSHDATS
jgi:hypothetical protein